MRCADSKKLLKCFQFLMKTANAWQPYINLSRAPHLIKENGDSDAQCSPLWIEHAQPFGQECVLPVDLGNLDMRLRKILTVVSGGKR